MRTAERAFPLVRELARGLEPLNCCFYERRLGTVGELLAGWCPGWSGHLWLAVLAAGADWLAVKLWGKVWADDKRSALIGCVRVGDRFPVGTWVHPGVPFLASDC